MTNSNDDNQSQTYINGSVDKLINIAHVAGNVVIASERAEAIYELCQQLLQSHVSSDSTVFGQVVKPLYEAFEKLHAEYMEGFAVYLIMTDTEGTSIPVLVERVRRDRLFRDAGRQKVRLLSASKIHLFSNSKANEMAVSLAEMIGAYVINPNIDWRTSITNNGQSMQSQRWRGALIQELEGCNTPALSEAQIEQRIREESSRLIFEPSNPIWMRLSEMQKASRKIENLVEEMQMLYTRVTELYVDLNDIVGAKM